MNPSPMVTMIVPVGMPSTRKTLKYIRLVPLMKMTSIQSTAIWRKHKSSGGLTLLGCHCVNHCCKNSCFQEKIFTVTWLDVHHKSILNFEDLLVVPSSYNNQDAICLWFQRDKTDENSRYISTKPPTQWQQNNHEWIFRFIILVVKCYVSTFCAFWES